MLMSFTYRILFRYQRDFFKLLIDQVGLIMTSRVRKIVSRDVSKKQSDVTTNRRTKLERS